MIKKYHFSDIQIVPRPTEVNSRSEVNLNVSYVTKHSKRTISGIPVCVSNLDTTGTLTMAKTLSKDRFFVALHKYLSANDIKEYLDFEENNVAHCFISAGMSDDEFDKIKSIYHENKNLMIMLDVANGYLYSFLDVIKKYRDAFPNCIICAGNVCTESGTENIIKAGADLVKVGIGQGNLCETSLKAGIGYPQFSAAQECARVTEELEALCMSDGGVQTPSDICLALATGCRFVMCGSLFLGYDECEGEWKYDGDKKTAIKAYGMSSKTANDKYNNGLQNYRASEGVEEQWVSYKGSVNNLILDIKGSLASCCSYTNTKNLENLHKNVEFILR
jgi:GMP reductase